MYEEWIISKILEEEGAVQVPAFIPVPPPEPPEEQREDTEEEIRVVIIERDEEGE